MEYCVLIFKKTKMFCRAVFPWRHLVFLYDVIMGRNFFFVKYGHFIYCWKARLMLIQNHIRNMGWKWSPQEIIYVLCCHVTITLSNKNLNISRGLHFQPLFLMWFWISIKRAFQQYITWPGHNGTWRPIMTSYKKMRWRHAKTAR